MRDKVTRQCPQTTTFEEKGEPKQIRTEVPLFTSLMPYHKAKPAHGSRWGKVRTRCSCCISLAVSLQVFHSHTCPLPVLLCFFHRLLRAVRHYWDAFQPEDPGRFVLSDGNAGLQQGNPWLTHLAPNKLLPFLYEIPCEGSNCVKQSWYTTLKINNKHQIKVSAHFVFFPVCKIHCFTGFDWEKKSEMLGFVRVPTG